MTHDPALVTKLDELLEAIQGYDDPRRATEPWKQVYRLLQKTDIPPGRLTAIVGMRDVIGLTGLIEQLSGPEDSAAASTDIPDTETCRRALRAFRKRQALTRLDEESTLGRSPLTSGKGASGAIVPPVEWPESVWQELVRQGRLHYVGHGMYELPKA